MKKKELKIIVNSFSWLLWKNVRTLFKNFLNKWIDLAIIQISFTIIFAYILPAVGLASNYGMFIMIGQVAASCVWTAQYFSSQIVADLEGPKTVSYELTLPLPYWLVYIKTALEYAIQAALLNLLNIPLGLALIWQKVDWTNISIIKLAITYPMINIFFGFFCLLIATYAKGIMSFSRFWMRWGAQLFFFSGYFFSWFTLYGLSKTFAYINLLNPLIYPFEIIRIPFMGQSEFINFWACLIALVLFSVIFALLGIKVFKKRLDCV
jgi:hypothetical protein